ncbi:MAG: O-acetylhomoserine aminocarboxypropyltransferase [Gammaproteobacteria bacterium]|nr:O-acetylhomoserine aminocarboxypropyltransferase [Gammaproteobacteria bacterium]
MKFETIAVHGGYSPEPTTNAVAVPIYQTTSYSFRDTQHGADLFDLKEAGNIYTRIMNPTSDVLENRVAALEGGVGALALASGSAATTYAIMTICEAGDNIVSTSTLYGGTYTLFAHQLPRFGVDVKFGDHSKIDQMEKLIDSKTKAIFCESIGNPAANVVDVPKMAKIAHKHNIPLIVDNTVPSPYIFRPIEHGADIVVHSLTKYMGGHGTTIGGIIVDSGKFPWEKHKRKFSRLNTPDMSYHGVVFTEAAGKAAFIVAARTVALRNMGAAISPFNSFLILQGIESLAVRMDRHCENAVKTSNFLLKHPNVTWVNYPGIPSSPDYPLVKKLMNGKASSVLSFGIKGGRVNGGKFIDNLNLITRLVNIGDAKSLACHPASTTHRQLSETELEKAGVPEDLVRLSIGIENIDDIIEDLTQALDGVFKKSKKKK